MQRVDAPEILDSDACSPDDVEVTLRDIGGVATTQKMVERAAQVSGSKNFSLLEVAAGSGEVPELVRQRLARRGIKLDVTLLDRALSHLPKRNHASSNHAGQSPGVVADALALPF